MSTCRICKMDGRDAHDLEPLKYGVRHYAHPDCLLAAKGEAAFTVMPKWQLESFPYFAAQRAGLVDSLRKAISR